MSRISGWARGWVSQVELARGSSSIRRSKSAPANSIFATFLSGLATSSFTPRMFVLTFRNVFATLKGPLFTLLDHSLLEYRQRVGRLHPFRLPAEPIDADLQDVVDSLRILQKLHLNRNYRPVTETLEMLLRETRAHLAFALRPPGEQVLANVLPIAELARKYEPNGGLSLRGFVEELRFGGDAIETGGAPIFAVCRLAEISSATCVCARCCSTV